GGLPWGRVRGSPRCRAWGAMEHGASAGSIVSRAGSHGARGLFRDDHLDEVLPRSSSVGLAALERYGSASRAPLAIAPVHNDLDVFLSLKGPSQGLLEVGMGLVDDDVHRPVALAGLGVSAKDAHEDSGKEFHQLCPESTRRDPSWLSGEAAVSFPVTRHLCASCRYGLPGSSGCRFVRSRELGRASRMAVLDKWPSWRTGFNAVKA